ncbi:DUF3099 domain-containing protein [Streptomyces clavuligerus]|nr:DUF3099 domain-containing protein [Streptomyces clavuligerus]EDY48096.1 integral membrane protein [Streptomyces clavuligerus]WDN53123.1 DUF3099 domain-containing protein [Streptomyces clavuligerus]
MESATGHGRATDRDGGRPRSYAGDMYARRRRAYFVLMGVCLFLFVSAWSYVRLFSVPAAVALCVVAMVIPPIAVIVANRRGPDDRWWDDPSGDPESDRWWDELDGKRGPRP